MATEIKPSQQVIKPQEPRHQRAKRRENIGPYRVEEEGHPKAAYMSQREAVSAGRVRTYEAGRILKIGEGYRQPGELVPEASTWFRLMDLIHTGFLISVEVSEQTYREAVQSYCPELTEELSRLVHLDLKENKK